MKTEAIAFLLTFALVGVASWTAGGCSSEENCPETFGPPDPQGPLSKLVVLSSDEQGQEVPSSVQPESGSLTVGDSNVVIEYVQDGVEHRVVYSVVGSL